MQNKPKNKNAGIIAAIAGVSALLLSFSMQAGILSAIQGSFADASGSQIQLVYSVCSLAALPSMFGVVKLCQIISKKKCVLLGVAILTVGGLLPTVLHSKLWMLYASSALIGFGMGFINISTATLISELFTGPDKGRVMGIQAAIQNVGAAAFSVIGGAIADKLPWTYAFLTYVLGIPIFVLFAILMPEDTVQKSEKQQKSRFLTQKFLILLGINFLFNLMSTGFQSNISMFIDTEQMGSVVLSGILTAFFMLIGVPIGFALGKYMQLMKRWSNVLVAGLAAGGMALIFTAHSLVPVMIGTVMVGAAFASYPPINMTFLCSIAQPQNVSKTLATNNACSCVARFASPVIINWITGLFGGGVRAAFVTSCIGLVVVFILLFFFNPVKNTDLEEKAG